MKRKMLWVLVSCLMVLSLMIVSCGQEEEVEEEEKEEVTTPEPTGPTGTIRVANANFGIESFDPNNTAATWGGAMYDTIMSWDPQGNNIGEAAESWTVSPDGKTWTFKVRQGVKFHNGDPVTSADFAWSVDRFIEETSTNPWAPRVMNNFASSSTPDEYTYVHTTNTPELTLVASFAALPILPKNYIETNGMDYFNDNPVGSGPWEVVEFTPETTIKFAANEDYWAGAPAFANVLETQAPEEATRVGMLKRDEVDLVFVSTDRVVELRDAGYKLQEIGLPTVGNINFSGSYLTDGPIKDIKVRQAMSYAINRQELSDTFYQGLAKPGSRWFMSDVTWGWDPDWKPDPYDPDLATKLLDEAGYPDAFDTGTIKLFTQATQADLMLILQGYWAELGIDVEIEIVEAAKFFDLMFVRATEKDDEIVGQIWPWVSANTFQNVYHSSNMFTSLGVHSTASDPAMDTLFDEVLTETDPDTQKRLWTEFTQKGYDLWVSVGLMELPSYWVVSDNLGEFAERSHLNVFRSYYGIQQP